MSLTFVFLVFYFLIIGHCSSLSFSFLHSSFYSNLTCCSFFFLFFIRCINGLRAARPVGACWAGLGGMRRSGAGLLGGGECDPPLSVMQ